MKDKKNKPAEETNPFEKATPTVPCFLNISEILDKNLDQKAVDEDHPQVFNQKTNKYDVEKREFIRAEPAKEVRVEFKTAGQFAQQYVQNISLGGMFIKTRDKPELGSKTQIRMNVPSSGSSEAIQFSLQAKVCRVTEQGIGLEFLNQDPEIQKKLEAYVKNTLPEGSELRTKAKKSSLERLQLIREAKASLRKKAMKALKVSSVVGLFLILNLFLGFQLVKEDLSFQQSSLQSIEVEGQEVLVKDIQAIRQVDEAEFELLLNNKLKLRVKNINALPFHLRQSLKVIQSIRPPEKKRRTKNVQGLTNIKNRKKLKK